MTQPQKSGHFLSHFHCLLFVRSEYCKASLYSKGMELDSTSRWEEHQSVCGYVLKSPQPSAAHRLFPLHAQDLHKSHLLKQHQAMAQSPRFRHLSQAQVQMKQMPLSGFHGNRSFISSPLDVKPCKLKTNKDHTLYINTPQTLVGQA